jgi:type I restriction enzyme S subunit
MKKVKLGDVCKIQSGGTPSRGNLNYWNNGNIPWVKISDIKEKYLSRTEEFITQEGLANSSAKIFPKETILYTIFATLGEVSILEIEATTNQAIAGLQIIDENICKDYLYYYLISLKPFVNEIGRGVAQNNINMQILRNFEIPLPSLEEQKAIARKLDKVSGLIEKRKTQLEKLSELVKSRFIELFGDSVINSMGWDTDTVIGVCDDIYGGGTPSKSHPEYYENGDIPWVSSKDMKTAVLYDSQIKINQLGVDNSTAKMVPVNSVIMVIRSGILKHTLPVAINAVPITVNQDLKVFIPSKRILSTFLMYQFKMLEKDILSGVRAVTADNIEFDSLKKREIIVPPIELQNQFASFVEQTDKSKYIEKISVRVLTIFWQKVYIWK